MNRHIRTGTLLGAMLLGAACGSDQAPEESEFFPKPEYTQGGSPSFTTRVSGVAWDPEAFFMNVANCGRECPLPPILSEGNPLYLRSAVRGATITLFDAAAFKPLEQTATADGAGMWLMPEVPSRDFIPFLPISFGTGAIPTEQIGPPLPPVPPAEYVPTLTVRPIVTRTSVCVGMDAAHISKKGILEAVAKYLTLTQGRSVTVEDLLNPARFHAIHLFWFFHPGNPGLRVPAEGTTLEAEFGQVLRVDWAPPGVPPDSLRSSRGFIVTEEATSPLGINVVVIPNNGPVPFENHYKIIDSKKDSASLRPWIFPPITGHVVPGQVTFIGLQLFYSNFFDQPPAAPPPPAVCLP